MSDFHARVLHPGEPCVPGRCSCACHSHGFAGGEFGCTVVLGNALCSECYRDGHDSDWRLLRVGQRLAAIHAIASRYDEYMGEPETGGEHWNECPLNAEGGVDHFTNPECYDVEGEGDDQEWTWNQEKAEKVCVCSVGDFYRIAKLSEKEQPV